MRALQGDGSNPVVANMPMVQNRLPPRYRVIEEVGQGGMAVVYRAQDETLKREVAIKVLHPHLLSEPESKARLEREARAVAKLQHDNILQIFDYSGSDSPSSYIVTEFIDGQTLKQFVTDRTLPAPEVGVLIGIEIARALGHAHSLGIIHRDVKPENVMVRKDGLLKLMDFGVAQIVDFERMTVTGQLLGSPAYMAPEALEGKPLDFRTDVFSVGIMLYQLTTGALPFSGRNPHEVLMRIAEGRFADPRSLNKSVADGLFRIIVRALARRPEDRYPTMAALLDDLVQFVTDAGLRDAREELRAYFTEQDGYARDLGARMTTALVAAGRKQRAAGRTVRALELWNRSLAIDPRNAEVARELRRLHGSRFARRAAMALAGTLAAGLLVLAIRPSLKQAAVVPPRVAVPAPLAPDGVAKAFRPVAPVAPTPAVATPRPSAQGMPASRRASVSAAATPAPHPASRPPTGPASTGVKDELPAKLRRFSLGPTPKRVEVWLDGAKQFDYEPGHTSLDVPWAGSHLVEFRSSYCLPYRLTLGPGHPVPSGDQIVAQLSWKDAFLVVKIVPPRPGVRIVVTTPESTGGGRPRRSLTPDPGVRMPIAFDQNDQSRKTLDVTVVAGEKTILKNVTVTAGETQTLTVPLDL